MMMPLMDGPATVQALKKINPAVKIIAASGLSSNGKISKIPAGDISHFLPKPYSAKSMLETLKAVLGKAQPE